MSPRFEYTISNMYKSCVCHELATAELIPFHHPFSMWVGWETRKKTHTLRMMNFPMLKLRTFYWWKTNVGKRSYYYLSVSMCVGGMHNISFGLKVVWKSVSLLVIQRCNFLQWYNVGQHIKCNLVKMCIQNCSHSLSLPSFQTKIC